MNEPDVNAIAAALAVPFNAAEVKFKPQTVSGNRALAIPYVDARVVQDRLDDVLGVMGWQDSYECLPDGSVVCRLRIRLGTEWITKEDVGGQSEQPDEGDRRKAAFSDALKRAAVKFGIGRYLYRMKPQWCDYDPQKRQFVRPPVLPVTQGTVRQKQKPANGKSGDRWTVAELIRQMDQKAAKDGLAKPGQVITHLRQCFPNQAADLDTWPESIRADVVAEAKAFVQQAPAEAAS